MFSAFEMLKGVKRNPLFFRVLLNMRCSTFYIMYIQIENNGIDRNIRMFGVCKKKFFLIIGWK